MCRFPRVQQLSYCKLQHGLLNANLQNKKFYGKPDTCPCCQMQPESFLHVLTCNHTETSMNRYHQQEALWKALASLHTPPLVLSYIRKGILNCAKVDLSISTSESIAQDSTASYDSLPDYVLFLNDAYNQKSTEIGWGNFLRGRISVQWKEAAYLESLSLQ
jgi:hypothetical protein